MSVCEEAMIVQPRGQDKPKNKVEAAPSPPSPCEMVPNCLDIT